MRHHRTVLTALLATVLLAGCGTQGECTPGGAPPAAPPKSRYAFGLPQGDRSPDQRIESAVYVELARSHCGDARAMMRRKDADGDVPGWGSFDDPRAVLLFQAAVELCDGETTRARTVWDVVSRGYGGWTGIGWDVETTTVLRWHVCEAYKSVGSALLQKSKDDLPCRRADEIAPAIVAWNTGDRPDPRLDGAPGVR
ncbi:hypothetical protein F4553_002512 [Allocatelliglobosispora scoriae]|uniref:Lipoprotein n=1 Tax=Allocatelliglobosispora scoriae TaxID=643052 RepID=A0A841BQB8_9ACTN|nr:hypothetical protein [Allocatelliglobosispora scoriae]MBB5869133.1 hypothetical protein [Allocatelliglobosispora scoriae]